MTHASRRLRPASERESRLQIDAAVQAALGEGADAARQVVRFAEKRRGDDAVDRPGIHVVEQVARLDRNGQVVALTGRSAAAQATEEAAGTAARTTREAAARTAATGSTTAGPPPPPPPPKSPPLLRLFAELSRDPPKPNVFARRKLRLTLPGLRPKLRGKIVSPGLGFGSRIEPDQMKVLGGSG